MAVLDSIKLLVPRGYYLLNEAGAKLALKAQINADAYLAQYQLSDKALADQTNRLRQVTAENAQLHGQVVGNATTIKLLTRKLYWANFWKYAAMGGAALLAVKVLSP